MPRPTQQTPVTARPRRSRARRRIVVALVAIAVVVVLAAAAAAAGGWYLFMRPEHDIAAGEPVEVTITQGASTAEIAETLVGAGIVENARMFRLRARNSQTDGQLKAGNYALTTGMSYDDALAALAKGPNIVFFDVPIPEGFTAVQIAARFAKRTGVSEDEMLALVTKGAPQFVAGHPYLAGAYKDSLEGYLFPATYRVKEGTPPADIVEMMLQKFDTEMDGIDLTFAKSKNLTPSDIVIMASVIEREARLDNERPLVSSVIYNRLKKRMRLQLCATVLYTMPAGTTRLTYDDLEVESPYNTYLHEGLPPGPISNPGLKSLQAAAAPAQSDYLYYVLTGEDGSHTFTASYSAFQKAVKKSRELTGD